MSSDELERLYDSHMKLIQAWNGLRLESFGPHYIHRSLANENQDFEPFQLPMIEKSKPKLGKNMENSANSTDSLPDLERFDQSVLKLARKMAAKRLGEEGTIALKKQDKEASLDRQRSLLSLNKQNSMSSPINESLRSTTNLMRLTSMISLTEYKKNSSRSSFIFPNVSLPQPQSEQTKKHTESTTALIQPTKEDLRDALQTLNQSASESLLNPELARVLYPTKILETDNSLMEVVDDNDNSTIISMLLNKRIVPLLHPPIELERAIRAKSRRASQVLICLLISSLFVYLSLFSSLL